MVLLSATPTTGEEREGLAALQTELAKDLASQPKWPELVGEIRLLRFLRGRHPPLPALPTHLLERGAA